MNNAMSPYFQAAVDIAELVEAKQLAYGDSFGNAGRVLHILFPDGIPVEKLEDALTIVRVIDKLFRIANQKEAFNESPWKDILGYALLAVVRDQKEDS